MQQPRIVEKPELKVIGYEAAFLHCLSPEATNFQVIGPLWDKLIRQAAHIPNKIGDEMFGIIYGRPETERTHPHELQYIAAVPVSSTAEVSEGMVSWTVSAGTFAVFTHRGPIRNIGETVSEIYRGWLPQSAYQNTEIADVELYDHRFCPDGADSEMEYWISVTPKASPA
ncbi:MAG: AraC family transcriptional regulator [Candidatus Saccharimonas sp.]|nr:AraC family transcriptional regulator [Planctomycetaceae bacterium]